MYKITFLPDAEESFKKLDKPIQKRIAQKIDDSSTQRGAKRE
jgi:mRNA-degrading endonuclease RelE of RelBE toxin-antitoxin system